LRKIAAIIGVMDSIAFNANIFALNAAVAAKEIKALVWRALAVFEVR